MKGLIIRKKILIKESKLNNLDRLESQVLKVSQKLCKGWDRINVSVMPHIERGKAYLLLTNFKSDSGEPLDLSYD